MSNPAFDFGLDNHSEKTSHRKKKDKKKKSKKRKKEKGDEGGHNQSFPPNFDNSYDDGIF